MKITVSQLRKVIKEEISRVLSEDVNPRLTKLASGNGESIALRNLVKKMVDDPVAAQQLADDWDQYCSVAQDIVVPVQPGGGVRSSDRNAAFVDAAEKAGLMDADATYYIATAYDSIRSRETLLTGQDLLTAADIANKNKEERLAASKNKSDALKAAKEAGVDLDNMYMSAQAAPYGSWRSEMSSYEKAKERIYKAWDPVAKKLDMEQLKGLV